MGNLSNIEQEWIPLTSDTLYEIPSDHPLICMEHKRTKEHAFYDIKLDRLLSQQEAFDALSGYH